MSHYPLVYSSWNKQELNAIKKVINSGSFTMGKKVSFFEKKFSSYLQKKYAVMVNSGSSANLISIAALFYKKNNPLKFGDEVIVPSVGWSTTYSPLQQLGLKLKVIDINLKDFNIDFNLLKKSITKKTKLVIVVNLLGIPAELKKIKLLCSKKKILFFEDNCESLGAKINKKKAGSFGDLSSHSFFYSHHMSTMEGGMVVTDNSELYFIMKAIRAHGWTRDLPKKNSIHKFSKKTFYENYNFIFPGFNFRPGEIHAAAGLVQLKKLDQFIKIRRKNLFIFNKYFKNNKNFLIPETKYESSSFAFPIVILNKSKDFKHKVFRVLKKNQIDFRLIAGGSFVSQPYSKYFNFKVYKNVKNAAFLHTNGFMIGNSSINLTNKIKTVYKLLSGIK
jgi:CDP-4-dehydro-6-deoxyglucose reductase, E1